MTLGTSAIIKAAEILPNFERAAALFIAFEPR